MRKTENWKVKLKDSIVTRISVANIIVFLLSCAMIVVCIMTVNIWYHYQKDVQMMHVYISNTLSSIDNVLKDIGRVSLVCFSDDETLEILANHREDSYGEQLDNQRYLQEFYTSLITIREDISGVYLFDNDSLIFYQDYLDPGCRDGAYASVFLQKIVEIEDTERDLSGCRMYLGQLPEFLHYLQQYQEDAEQNNNIYLVRPVRSFSPFEVIGHIVLRTPILTIQDIADEYLAEGMEYYLVDGDGIIVCCQDSSVIGQDLKRREPDLYGRLDDAFGNFRVNYEGRSSLVSYQVSEYSDMTLITVKPMALIIREMQGIFAYCVGIVIIFALMAAWSTYRKTKKGLRSVKELAQDMNGFEPSNMTRRYEVEVRDEVSQLKMSFNYMMDIINELIITEYENKMQLQEAQLQEQKLSMLYLKSQVNPHFLYNTLDVIRNKAAINGDEEVSHMLMELVSFYRLSSRVESALVSVSHEVKMLDAYMKLMCFRYPRLTYRTEIDDRLLEVLMPNFILQPIVENSIMHGLRNRGYIGTVTLQVLALPEEPDAFRVIVSDNGVGMPEEMIDRMNQRGDACILEADVSRTEGKQMHIGLNNVRQRLEWFYGQDGSLLFRNLPEGGVCVGIKMKRSVDL